MHRQFSHPSSKKLCDLVKNAGVKDPEFIKILQTLPNSCELCICYKKTEPKRSAKKKLLGKSPGSTCEKNPQIIVSATEIKFNSSFFNKDANTTLINNMNATQFHFDSSDSEENLNSRRKKKDRP